MAATTTRRGPEPELVSAALDGDPRALDALIAESLPLVYNLVGRALNGHEDVDDVVQETMLRVVRKLPDLRRPDAYRSWLVSIALRQARENGRRRGATRMRTSAFDQAHERADLASDFAAATVLRLGLTDQRRDIAEATRWLDPADRELLSLWWLEQSGRIERSELVAALDLSAAHAAVRVHRMKRQLDTSRGVVRALRDLGRCSRLRTLAGDWDGTPNPLWRKRFDRHIRGCDTCAPQGRSLVPVANLLRGLPLVPVPAGLAWPGTSVVGGPAQPGRLPQPGTSRVAARGRARRGLRAHAHRTFVAAHPVALTAAASVVTAAVVAGFVLAPHSHGEPVAAAARVDSPTPPPASATASPSPSARPDAGPTSAAASSAKPASAAAAVPSAPTGSRKGVAAWSFAYGSQALAESGAAWYYTWSTGTLGISAPGVGFVPMISNAGDVTADALAQAKGSTSCGCLLGFNEPDNANQANMTPAQALALWPQLESTGLELGSPAVSYGAATSGGWLDQFMTGARQRGYRVGFITLHWYGSDFDTSAAVGQLQSYIEAVYAKYRLPIWLTEFALIDFTSGGSRYPSEAQQAAFLTAATEMLDALPYVQRYAWFGLPATGAMPNSGLFENGPVLTPVGSAFEAAR